MAKAKGHPIVLVEWTDSCSRDGWHDVEKSPSTYQTAKCRSVGWLLEKDENRVVLFSDGWGDEIGRIMAIPMGCVKSIKTLARA